MDELTPHDLGNIIGEDPQTLGRWINAFIQQYAIATQRAQGIDRFEGLRPHRALFAHLEFPVEILELLWSRTEESYSLRLPVLEDALRIAILDLKSGEGGRPLAQPVKYAATVFLQLIRRQRIGALFDAVTTRFMPRTTGWSKDKDLFFETMEAALACSEHRHVRSFMEAFFEREMFRDPHSLSLRHLAVAWVTLAKGHDTDGLPAFVETCRGFETFIRELVGQHEAGATDVGTLASIVYDEIMESPIVNERPTQYDELTLKLPHCCECFLPTNLGRVEARLKGAALMLSLRYQS